MNKKGLRFNEDILQNFVNDFFTMADFYGDRKSWEQRPFIHLESSVGSKNSYINLDHGNLARKILKKWKSRMERKHALG